MKKLSFYIFFVCQFVQAQDSIYVLDENQVTQIFSPALLDHTGFHAVSRLTGLEMNPSKKIFPVFPMFKKGFFNQKIVGGVIPAKYLGLREINSGIYFSTVFPNNPQLVEAKNQIIEMGLNPVLVNNNLIGLNSETDQIVIGEEYSFGLSLGLDWNSSSIADLTRRRGFVVNPFESLNGIVSSINSLIEGPQSEKALSEVLKFMPYLQYTVYSNALPSNSSETVLRAIRRSELHIERNLELALPIPVLKSDFSGELQRGLADLNTKLAKEIEWQKKVFPETDQSLILESQTGNQLIQNICDRLSASYQIPKEIWPRCRILGSWVPNAFAYPGGDVFITAGLIGVLSDLDAVSFVLGHEIGHVVGRHTSKAMSLSDAVSLPINVLALAANMFSLGAGGGLLGPVTLTNWFPQVMGSAMVTGEVVSLFSKGALAGLMSYSREHERQADRFGHQTSLSVGAENKVMITGWAEFSGFIEKYVGLPQGVKERIFSSHPQNPERLRALNDRYRDFQTLHNKYNSNRLAANVYDEYRSLHLQLKPYVEKYGQRILDERNRGNHVRSSYLANSFFLSGSQCVNYSLQGLINN